MNVQPKFKKDQKVWVCYVNANGENKLYLIGPVTVCEVAHEVKPVYIGIDSHLEFQVDILYKINSTGSRYYENAVFENLEAALASVLPKVTPPETLTVTAPDDIALLTAAKGSTFGATVLPSGNVIPAPPNGKTWRVINNNTLELQTAK